MTSSAGPGKQPAAGAAHASALHAALPQLGAAGAQGGEATPAAAPPAAAGIAAAAPAVPPPLGEASGLPSPQARRMEARGAPLRTAAAPSGGAGAGGGGAATAAAGVGASQQAAPSAAVSWAGGAPTRARYCSSRARHGSCSGSMGSAVAASGGAPAAAGRAGAPTRAGCAGSARATAHSADCPATAALAGIGLPGVPSGGRVLGLCPGADQPCGVTGCRAPRTPGAAHGSAAAGVSAAAEAAVAARPNASSAGLTGPSRPGPAAAAFAAPPPPQAAPSVKLSDWLARPTILAVTACAAVGGEGRCGRAKPRRGRGVRGQRERGTVGV
jgi:hypothetical protein